MGDKRPSIRTLPSGEKIMHYPGGEEILIPQNRIAELLEYQAEDDQQKSEELRTALLDAVKAKQESLDAGDSVPHDKRSV